MSFRLVRPKDRPVPVVVEIPHAGLEIPPEVAGQIALDENEARRDADLFVDQLFRSAPSFGATLLAATLSRYVVDLNRDESDVDARAVPTFPNARTDVPRGVIWLETTAGRSVLRHPLTLEQYDERIAHYYRRYHQTLASVLEDIREQFGYAILLCAHSMPATAREGDREQRRADVVPGTRGRTTAAAGVIDTIDLHFRSAGLSVRHDDPYRGGATTVRWGRPAEQFHAVQLELNRGLYVDETSGQKRHDAFQWLASLCESLVGRLGEIQP